MGVAPVKRPVVISDMSGRPVVTFRSGGYTAISIEAIRANMNELASIPAPPDMTDKYECKYCEGYENE